MEGCTGRPVPWPPRPGPRRWTTGLSGRPQPLRSARLGSWAAAGAAPPSCPGLPARPATSGRCLLVSPSLGGLRGQSFRSLLSISEATSTMPAASTVNHTLRIFKTLLSKLVHLNAYSTCPCGGTINPSNSSRLQPKVSSDPPAAPSPRGALSVSSRPPAPQHSLRPVVSPSDSLSGHDRLPSPGHHAVSLQRHWSPFRSLRTMTLLRCERDHDVPP